MADKLYCEECNDWIIPMEGVTSIFMFGNQVNLVLAMSFVANLP